MVSREPSCLLEHDSGTERGVVEAILDVHRCSVVQEVAYRLQVAFAAGQMEWCTAIVVRDIEIVVTALEVQGREDDG